jgi:hypothetical protein
MWLERFLIIVPSLAHKYLPYSWGSYRPTWVEITITVGTFAGMGMLYLLFAKFVPIISMWELKVGLQKAVVSGNQSVASATLELLTDRERRNGPLTPGRVS